MASKRWREPYEPTNRKAVATLFINHGVRDLFSKHAADSIRRDRSARGPTILNDGITMALRMQAHALPYSTMKAWLSPWRFAMVLSKRQHELYHTLRSPWRNDGTSLNKCLLSATMALRSKGMAIDTQHGKHRVRSSRKASTLSTNKRAFEFQYESNHGASSGVMKQVRFRLSPWRMAL